MKEPTSKTQGARTKAPLCLTRRPSTTPNDMEERTSNLEATRDEDHPVFMGTDPADDNDTCAQEHPIVVAAEIVSTSDQGGASSPIASVSIEENVTDSVALRVVGAEREIEVVTTVEESSTLDGGIKTTT